MKIANWIEIEAAGTYEKLPVGGYVLVIKEVVDNEKKEQLELVYDIACGDYAQFYENEDSWRHKFVRSYSDKAEAFFKQFLDVLQASNKMEFTIEGWQKKGCNPDDFVGLIFGGLIQERYYTNGSGEDKTALEVAGICPANDIISGNYRLPEPRDQRTPKEEIAAAQADNDSDLPWM